MLTGPLTFEDADAAPQSSFEISNGKFRIWPSTAKVVRNRLGNGRQDKGRLLSR